MLPQIIAAENRLDKLLPTQRLVHNVPPDLLNAAQEWSALVSAQAVQLGAMLLGDKQIDQGLQLAQNPVFICGVHRSGTTLLRDILDGHPDLVVLPSEGTYYTNIESKLRNLPHEDWSRFITTEWLRRLANPINQAPYWLLGRSCENNSPYVDFARYVMAWCNLIARNPGTQWPHTAIVLAYASCTNNLTAKYWVDKTPTNERYLNRIWHEMSRAKVIHIIREPVATLTSRKQMEPAITLHHALGYLSSSFAIAARMKAIEQPNYLLLRYEDLCDHSEAYTRKIAHFLDIETSASLNVPSQGGKPSTANSSFNSNSPTGVILKPDEHRHKNVLSHQARQSIMAVIGNVAQKHGYQLEHIGLIKRLYLKLLYRLKINAA